MKPSIVAYMVMFHWWLQAWIEILDGGFHDFSKLHTPKLWEMKNPPTRNEVHLPGSPVFQNCAAKKKTVGVRAISSNHHFYRLVSEPPLFYSQDYNHHQKGFQKRLRNLATRFALNAPGNASWRSKGSCVGLFWERELFTTKAAYLDLPVWVPNGFVTDLFNSPSLRFFFSDGHPEKGEGAA